MPESSLSVQEIERLAELRGLQLLDTAPEERFDRITRTAQRLFGVPVALISLLDRNRQWFKSSQGWSYGDLQRPLVFSAHALRQDDPLIVEDAAGDARFADDPFVAGEPGIRFYAGWPLRGPGGNRVGTLDLVDFMPRRSTAADAETLRDLAGWAESEMKSHMVQQSMEVALRSESRLHTVVDNVADAIITLDQYGKIDSFNHAAQRIFGYAPEEVMGQNIKVLMPSVYHEAHDGYLQKFRDTGRTRIIGLDREVTGRRKSGELFPMELTVNEMWLQGQRGFAGIIRDITERRKAERKLRESDVLLRAVMRSTSSFAYVRDLEERFVYVNSHYEQVFGFRPGEVIGKTIEQVFGPELATYNRRKDRMVLASPPDMRHEDEIHRPDTGHTYLVVRSALCNEDGEPYGTCGVGTDITLRKNAERMKNEFISTVSHELRTPLTSIRGSLGLLAGGVAGELPERAKALLDIANNNSERLVRLINDILDIEKIESGNMRFDMIGQHMLPLVEQAIAATSDFAAQFQVKFELAPDAEDAEVAVDGDRIVQVIVNLLSNAAKFSPAGGTVKVTLSRRSGCVRLTVADQGQGIAEEFRDRIFQKFAQADASSTRQKGGTGLGLSISRAIVERHHGRIDFDSRPGDGTEFHVELPLVVATPQRTIAARVLVVEDDRDIARLLAMMLQQSGMECDVAYDAQQARRLLEEHEYTAMTLDLALPGEDGISLLRWMRSRDHTRCLPVVVVSADADQERRKFIGGAIGILDWIPKPIDQQRLLAALHGAVLRRDESVPKVLHVEDDADLAKVMVAMLEPAFSLRHAPTLEEARQLLALEQFALILLDLQLPDGHGSELFRSLPPRNATTPIVVFSVEEANRPTIESVHAALVKSRTSNEQLLSILNRLIGDAGAAVKVGQEK
jgi:PAS domain S-box-containing protein